MLWYHAIKLKTINHGCTQMNMDYSCVHPFYLWFKVLSDVTI